MKTDYLFGAGWVMGTSNNNCAESFRYSSVCSVGSISCARYVVPAVQMPDDYRPDRSVPVCMVGVSTAAAAVTVR